MRKGNSQMGIKVTKKTKPKLYGRELAEAKRLEKLDEIRQKRLDKKNKKATPSGLSMTPSIIKKRKSTKPKLTGRDLAEAKRLEKLKVLKLKSDVKKALSKKDKNSDKSIKTSIRPKARPIISASTTTVTNSVVPKARKFNEEVKTLKKELTKAKTKPEKTKIEKKIEAMRLAFKKKERRGKGSGFRISGAGDDMDFIMKMLKK